MKTKMLLLLMGLYFIPISCKECPQYSQHPPKKTLKEIIESSEIGKVVKVEYVGLARTMYYEKAYYFVAIDSVYNTYVFKSQDGYTGLISKNGEPTIKWSVSNSSWRNLQ